MQIINSENRSYLINDKINEYIEESNGNKYLTLVSTDESKNIRKKYEDLWNKIRDFLDQNLITQTIIMKNISKSKLIQMMIYL